MQKLLLIPIALLLVVEISEPPQVQRKEWTVEEKTWVKSRMKYHGIERCVKDEKGYYFIDKKNKRCKL